MQISDRSIAVRQGRSGAGFEALADADGVVAWRIDRAVALPVTPGEGFRSHNCLGEGVLAPDGSVSVPYDTTYPSEEAWMMAMGREAEKWREDKVKAKAEA